MSLPWIAFYPGAYLKNTVDLTLEQHGAYLLLLMECWTKGRIPKQNETKMALICRISVGRFRRKIAPILDQYFNADGTNKRAIEEVEKAETLHNKRALAGRKGGFKSALVRRSKRSKREANGEANAKQTNEARLHQSERYITSTSLDAARAETASVENPPATDTAAAAPKQPPRKEGKQEFRHGPPGTQVGPEVLR